MSDFAWEPVAANTGLSPLLWLLRTYWLRIAVCGAIGIVVGVSVYFVLPKSYRADVTVATTEAEMFSGSGLSQLAQLSGFAGMALPTAGSSYRQEAIATLKSREIIREFIEQENIAKIIKSRFPVLETASPSEQVDWLNRVTSKFQHRILDVRDDRRSGMIVVAISWTDPEVAAAWANGFVALADERLRLRRRRNADESLALIEDVISKTNVVDLRQTLYRMYQMELERKIQTQVNESIFFRIIDPAVPPDARKPSSPDIRFLVVGSALMGLVTGLALSIFSGLRSRVDSRPS